MTDVISISSFFKNQAELASVIAGGIITRAARIKAHRIWRGERKPNDEELNHIYSATGGKLDANYFAGLPSTKNPKRKR